MKSKDFDNALKKCLSTRPMNKKQPHELDNLNGTKNYKGVLITREGIGYRVLGEYVESPEMVDMVLKEARKELGDSIVVDTRNGSFKFINDGVKD